LAQTWACLSRTTLSRWVRRTTTVHGELKSNGRAVGRRQRPAGCGYAELGPGSICSALKHREPSRQLSRSIRARVADIAVIAAIIIGAMPGTSGSVRTHARHSHSKPSRRGLARPDRDPAMPSHKFHVGESVTLMPSISRNVTTHAGGSPGAFILAKAKGGRRDRRRQHRSSASIQSSFCFNRKT
jgi:hypothetical protein